MSILDLTDVIREFALPGGVDIERRMGTGLDPAGNPDMGSKSLIHIDVAVVQPVSGRDLLLLPAGDQTKEAIWVDTLERLVTSREAGSRSADVVLYKPEGEVETYRYRVLLEANWRAQSGRHTVMAVREASG